MKIIYRCTTSGPCVKWNIPSPWVSLINIVVGLQLLHKRVSVHSDIFQLWTQDSHLDLDWMAWNDLPDLLETPRSDLRNHRIWDGAERLRRQWTVLRIPQNFSPQLEIDIPHSAPNLRLKQWQTPERQALRNSRLSPLTFHRITFETHLFTKWRDSVLR